MRQKLCLIIVFVHLFIGFADSEIVNDILKFKKWIKKVRSWTQTKEYLTDANQTKFSFEALNMSDTKPIDEYEDNKFSIVCPFGETKKQFSHIKWYLNREPIDVMGLRNRTQSRVSVSDNKIRIQYLKLEDSGLYSCQLKIRKVKSAQELVSNTTNFRLEVYPYLRGGIDIRSPKVTAKIMFFVSLAIFSGIIFKNSQIHKHFE